jgi:phosphoesterase RecJ-like protein
MNKEKINEVKKIIEGSDNFLIISHEKPDGDALGSVLAMKIALEKQDKKAIGFCVDFAAENFNFLPSVEKIKNDPKIVDEFIKNLQNKSSIILVDCSEIYRTGLKNLKKKNVILAIDHHPVIHPEAKINIIEPKVSSASEIIFKLFKNLDIEIDKDIATCLLTGIVSDTGGFQHSNTTSETLEISAELMKKGVRLNKITKKIFRSKDKTTLKLWGRALARIKKDPKTGLAFSIITYDDLKECGVSPEDLSGLSSIISTAKEARFALLLTEYEKGKLSGSLRSEEFKGVDVSQIAKLFNGGGHKFASGFKIEGSGKESFLKIKEKLAESLAK